MLRSDSLASSKIRVVGSLFPLVGLLVAVLGMLSPAMGQDFQMSLSGFTPFAIEPGGQANANISLNIAPNFTSAGPVNLTCSVTSNATGVTLPDCAVSPSTVTPPGSASLIVSTSTANGVASAAGYTVTVSASDASVSTPVQMSQTVAVLSATSEFTITVTNLIAPSSVVAGNAAQATITVTPLQGYTGVVTLACSSITPVTINPPFCAFTYPQGSNGLPVNGVTSTTLTITTLGPIPTTAASHNRIFYALWLPMPLVGVLVMGIAGGKRARKPLVMLAVFVVGGSLLLTPACGNSTPSNNPTGAVTPANTYTFTLSGVDQNGVVSSNAGTTTGAPTVTLSVTAPK